VKITAKTILWHIFVIVYVSSWWAAAFWGYACQYSDLRFLWMIPIILTTLMFLFGIVCFAVWVGEILDNRCLFSRNRGN
jgi:hypothetical protein